MSLKMQCKLLVRRTSEKDLEDCLKILQDEVERRLKDVVGQSVTQERK